MVEKEFGLDIAPDTARISAGVTMGLSYMLASVVPLLAYFFLPIQPAFFASLALTFLCLIGVGVVRGKLAKLNLVQSAGEIVLVGTVSGLGGYFLGTWLPHLLGY
ncbi:MAG: VIT1/CCC1 transporter family protein [Chloroflexia bacterium]